ncbi:hypothetical protein JW933_09995 [candidate division FCPU426 bacterium]|nr:hypothetical protein [candidate division FCPU426 bacterium]
MAKTKDKPIAVGEKVFTPALLAALVLLLAALIAIVSLQPLHWAFIKVMSIYLLFIGAGLFIAALVSWVLGRPAAETEDQ